MFKKIIALTALLCALPMLANAYTLNTWVQTTGGNLVVNNGTPQTNVNGSVFKSYAASVPVTVTAASGFAIKSVTRNGVTVATSGTTYPTTMNPADSAMQSVIASFAPANLVTLSAAAAAGGSVSPASFTNVRPGTQTPPLSFVFSPGTGNALQSISGLPGSGVTLTNALTGDPVVLPADPNVPVRASFTSVSGAATLVGTFLNFIPVVANAGLPQTILVGGSSPVTLQSASTGPVTGYLWTQTAGPSVTLSGATTATATFPAPTTLASYKFNLKVTGANNTSNASTTVIITNSAVTVSRNQCQNCHGLNGVGVGVFVAYSASLHAHNPYDAVICASCHVGANTGGHTGLPVGSVALGNICLTCHIPYTVQAINYLNSSHYTNPFGIGVVTCANCHNPHSTVATFGAGTTAGCQTCHAVGTPYGIYSSNMVLKAPHGGGVPTPAAGGVPGKTQYVTQGLMCTDCHAHNNLINAQWAEGGHGRNQADTATYQGPWSHYDWGLASRQATSNGGKDGSNCARCHSAWGFIKFLNQTTNLTRLRNVSGQPNAVLACVGCHNTNIGAVPGTPEGDLRINSSQISSGYTAVYAARAVTSGTSIGQGALAPTNTYAFGDQKFSNICIPCHSGRANGTLVKQVFANAGNNGWNGYSTAQTNLYMHAFNPAPVVFGTGAYEYQNASVYAALAKPHSMIETGATADMGPCVGCHYTSEKPHSLETVNAATQQIVSTQCATCHGAGFTYAVYDNLKSNWAASVVVLNSLMQVNGLNVAERADKDMGFVPSINGPAAIDNTATRGEQNFGAWFNWSVLTNADPNAFAHNPAYARQIQNDTILYLANGSITGSVTNVISTMTASGAITPAQGQAANAYFTDNGCLGCHSGTSSTAPKGIQQPNHYAIANVPGNFYNPAFKAYTSAASRNDQYYTLNNSCTACHTGIHTQPQVTIQHVQWADNVHGEVNNIVFGGAGTGRQGTDFKVLGAQPGITYTTSLTPGSGKAQECVRCHTTTGYINFSNSGYSSIQAWGNPVADKTKEVITCAACHTDAVGTVRTVNSWTAYVGYSTALNARSGNPAEMGASWRKFAFALPVSTLGESNVCAACHSHGRNKAQVSGSLVKQLNAFASYSVARVSVTMTSGHGGPIAAVPFLTDNEYVYKFALPAGVTYTTGSHGKIGMNDYLGTGNGGPCGYCHLNSDMNSPQGGHTFAAWKNWSSTTAGQVAKASCNQCHIQGSFIPFDNAYVMKSMYGAFGAQSSVKRVLRKNLGFATNKSLAPSATNAIKFYTGVGNFTYANRANLQGANLNSLMPSNSWWLHGPMLVKQVLFDSIDVALHGVITGSLSGPTGLLQFATDNPTYLTVEQASRTLQWLGNGGNSRPIPFD